MTTEEFISAVGADKVQGKIDGSNEKYRLAVLEYVTDNTPCKLGIPYVIEDIGVRTDLDDHKKRKRAFIVTSLDVSYAHDGSPLIVANGNTFVNGTQCTIEQDHIGTFKCVIHGSMGAVKFKQFIKPSK